MILERQGNSNIMVEQHNTTEVVIFSKKKLLPQAGFEPSEFTTCTCINVLLGESVWFVVDDYHILIPKPLRLALWYVYNSQLSHSMQVGMHGIYESQLAVHHCLVCYAYNV